MSLLSFRACRSACALLLCLAAGMPAQGAVLTTTLSSSSVAAGRQFTFDVIVSELAAGQAVAGFDLDLVFDPALLTADHVTFSPLLGVPDLGQFTSALLGPGRADLAAVSMLDEAALLGLQSGTFTLAQLVFNAVAPGAAAIDFDALTAPGLLLSDQSGTPIAVTAYHGARIDVTGTADVPEPSSLLLMASALMALGLATRTSRGARAAA